jgi:hypothetical protein
VASEGKSAGDADGADGVQLVGVVQDLGLQGCGVWPGAEAVGGYGMGHGVDHLGRVICQKLAGYLSSGVGVVGCQPVAVTAGNVVKQGGSADDFYVGAFGLCQSFGQGQNAQHVVKVVDGVAAYVELACLFDGDHAGSSKGVCFYTGLGSGCLALRVDWAVTRWIITHLGLRTDFLATCG